MKQPVVSLLVLSILVFVCVYCQLPVNSRVKHEYSSLKNGNVQTTANSTGGVCEPCVNSTCSLPSGYCYIGGLCLQDGDAIYACLKCDSSQNQFEWSYNSVCLAGDARCSNIQFMAQHVCDSSTISAFYTDFQNATVALFNPKCSTLSCQPGFFFSTFVNASSNTTQTVLFSCCPGYFCPNGQICMIPCRDAAYCPSPLTPNNGFCDTDVDCPQNAPAQFNEYGCGGSSVEGFCQSQSYCPNSSTKISCGNLDSTYCPSGVIEPVVCPFAFTCQGGVLDNTRIWAIAMAVVLFLVGLLILFRLIVNLRIIRYIAKKYESWSCCPQQINKRKEQAYVLKEEEVRKEQAHAVQPEEITIEQADADVVEQEEISDYFKASSNPLRTNSNGFSVKLENAMLDIPKCKDFNEGFTFTVETGQINAIMGQSGCGKTSLLYAIQGRKSLQKGGKIVFNGNSTQCAHSDPLTTCLSDFVGYVPQEDVMHSDLTVFETVYLSARARRLADDRKQIRNDVEFVLNKLGLTEKRHTVTEKLSGGEKKRVNIAMEVVACPKVLLLDEPTSGLDTVVCDKVFELLNIIKQNRSYPVNIILIIHQPSYELFEQIDHLVLLSPDCYLAYNGPRNDALVHLRSIVKFDEDSKEYGQIYKSKNDCDCCIYALAHYKNTKAVVNQSKNSLQTKDPSIFNFRLTKIKSIWMPIIYLMHRTSVQMFRRNYATEAIYGLAFFLLGLIIGRLFRKQTQSCDLNSLPSIYFLISLGFGIASCIASLRLFGVEMVDKTFIRETRNYYHPIQYWLAKSVVNLVHLFFYPLLFLTMLYIEIKPRSTFGEYYSVLLAMSFACSGIGQFVSVACQKIENSYLAATLIALISCLLSGFNPTKQEQLHDIVYLSFSRHVQRQLFLYDTGKYAQNASNANLWDTQIGALRLYYSFDDNERSIACLVGIGIIFRFLTIVFLYGRSEYRSKFRFYSSKLFDKMGYQPR